MPVGSSWVFFCRPLLLKDDMADPLSLMEALGFFPAEGSGERIALTAKKACQCEV
jgi:hypothetical protein